MHHVNNKQIVAMNFAVLWIRVQTVLLLKMIHETNEDKLKLFCQILELFIFKTI